MKQTDGMSQADALAWLLTAHDLCYADLYTLTLLDGSVWRFTSADAPLVWGGNTYRSDGIVITRGAVAIQLDVQVQTLALTVTPDRDDASLAGLVQQLDFGTLRGARVSWRGWFGDEWTLPKFTVLEFSGRVSTIEDDEATVLTCYSDLVLLNTKMPRNVYQSTCLWELYEAGCGKDRAALTDAGTVQAGSTATQLKLAGAVRAAGYYARGGVRVTSGALSGQMVSVRGHAIVSGQHVLTLASPLPAAPAASVTVDVWPGCDRAQATCDTKFGNLAKFRGMPYVPVPETAT